MGNNTTLNPGLGGDTVRNIDKAATGAKAQVVLLDMGGGAGADPENIAKGSLPVAVASSMLKVVVIPTVTAATYAANKVVGGIMTFANILPASYAGILESISLKFKGSVQLGGFWVAIFSASPAGTFTDTNTAAIVAADSALLLGLYHLTGPVSVLGTHTTYNLDAIAKALIGSSTSLYVVVVPDSTTAALGSIADMLVELAVMGA